MAQYCVKFNWGEPHIDELNGRNLHIIIMVCASSTGR